MQGKPSRPLNELFLGAVTVGERGQIVIPAEAREKYGLKGGEKLLVFDHPGDRGLLITRVEDVQALVEDVQQFAKRLGNLAEE